MKVSTSVISRPKVETKLFTFSDPANEACTVPMTLRKLSAMEQVAAADIAREYAVRYVHGIGEKGTDGYQQPEPFPPIDGQPVYLSDSACQVGAFIEYAQVCADEDRYTFEEIVSFMTVTAIANGMASASVWTQNTEVVEDPKEISGA